jgi:hypothetical protein
LSAGSDAIRIESLAAPNEIGTQCFCRHHASHAMCVTHRTSMADGRTDGSMANIHIRLTARIAFALAAIVTLPPPLVAQHGAWGSSQSPHHDDTYDAAQRGPLARLVRNPDRSGGLPPFALTDQDGTIQRYVEPVPGIDLAPYVGQVVTVRHDTGPTLLASQLELPSQPLFPMLGATAAGPPSRNGLMPLRAKHTGERANQRVRQAQYADSDDQTVELLPDGEAPPDSAASPLSVAPPTQSAMPDGAVYPDGEYPMFPDGMQPDGMMPPMGPGPGYYEPMYGMQPQMYGYPQGVYPQPYGACPCPECSAQPSAMPYGAPTSFVQPFETQRKRAHLYAAVELNAIRAHLMEEQFGKLSEKYEFSPRIIVGFTGLATLDGRARYWLYDRETQGVSDGAVRLEMDVLDLEATHNFAGRRSEVVLGAGLRLARIELTDEGNDDAGADLAGLTVAADGHTPLLTFKGGRLGWAYGGRLSILGGDWGGDDDNDFVDGRFRDDNVVVHELYAGIEFGHCFRNVDFHARLAFEMQNWHSDVLADSADTDSLGFIGPGIRIGAEF